MNNPLSNFFRRVGPFDHLAVTIKPQLPSGLSIRALFLSVNRVRLYFADAKPDYMRFVQFFHSAYFLNTGKLRTLIHSLPQADYAQYQQQWREIVSIFIQISAPDAEQPDKP